MARLIDLIRGWAGKPSHPPLTDASIGAYTVGVAMLVAGKLGLQDRQMAYGSFIGPTRRSRTRSFRGGSPRTLLSNRKQGRSVHERQDSGPVVCPPRGRHAGDRRDHRVLLLGQVRVPRQGQGRVRDSERE